MTLILDLSPAQERELEIRAEREGVPVDEYALRRLLPSYANGGGKLHSVLEFAGIAPSGRTAAEIDADIHAMRDEWDERERAFRQPAPPQDNEARDRNPRSCH